MQEVDIDWCSSGSGADFSGPESGDPDDRDCEKEAIDRGTNYRPGRNRDHAGRGCH